MLELQKNSWKFVVVLFMVNVIFKIIRGFDISKIENNQLSVSRFTAIDYALFFLILMSISMFLMKLKFKKHIFLNICFLFVTIAIELLLISGMQKNSSYICYGWKFPLHEYIFPIIPPIKAELLVPHNTLLTSTYITIITFGIIMIAYTTFILIGLVKAILN